MSLRENLKYIQKKEAELFQWNPRTLIDLYTDGSNDSVSTAFSVESLILI